MPRGAQLTKRESTFLDMLFREWDRYFKDYIPTLEETKKWYDDVFLPSLKSSEER